jgi:tetratricopeptide (TPR) repeat protein
MRLAVLAFMFCSVPAVAGTPIDKMLGSVGSVSMDTDRVDVALYSSPNGDPFPSVQVTVGENQYLFKLETSGTGIYAGARFAKNQELKVRTGNAKLINLKGEKGKYRLGGERKFATVDEVRIGDLVLHDIVVATTEWDSEGKKRDWQAPTPSGVSYDGVIGLQSLPEDISWAIRPSVAQVSFARGEAVAGLATQGITVPYTESDSSIYKYGTRKGLELARSMIVDMDIGGVTMPTLLASSLYSGVYVTETPNPAALNGREIDVFTRYHPMGLGGTSLGSTWFAEFTDLPESPGFFKAMIGINVLHKYDISVDRGASTITLSEATNPTWNFPQDFLIAEALKAVAPAEDEEDQEEGETEGEDAKPPGDPGSWTALKDLYVSKGDLNGAIEAMTTAIKFDERDCTSWLTLGHLQIRSGDIASAIASFETASKGYHDWYDLSLDRREELEKERKKMDKDEKEASEHYPAASACHRADGHLAAATFSAGDLNTVENLYRERLDLDPDLALVTANAMITKGDYVRAQEPLRQALKMRGGGDSNVRLALAMVYANTGDWGQASTLFDRSLASWKNTQSIKVWLDAYKSAQGHASAVEAASSFAQQHPESKAAQYGLAYVMAGSEEGTARSEAHASGKALFKSALAQNPHHGSTWAVYSRWLTLWGEGSAAEAAANKALELNPGKASSLIAMAEVFESKEEFARAKQYTLKAAQANPYHPGYANLVNTITE